MTQDILLPALSFAFASTMTPGPNNLMLMASGANFGFRRTVPHMLGVGLGVAFMVFLMGLGLMQLFQALPALQMVLKILCVLYMLWLAWKIAHASPPGQTSANTTPLSFLQAAAFQWVNPKAWAMATVAITTFAPENTLEAVALVSGCFIVSSTFSTTGWTGLGGQARRILARPELLRGFNVAMALLLLGSLYPILQI